MNLRIVVNAVVTAALCGAMPAGAADAGLVQLLMPEVKLIAGVNVEKAKASPFGRWVLEQVQQLGTQLKELAAVTGFDATRDVQELLVGTAGGSTPYRGLVLARGTFEPERIQTRALAAGGASEVHRGVTIIEDSKQTIGLAFMSATLAIGGDVPNVKAAIDRQNRPTSLPTLLDTQIQSWSAANDAWIVSAASPGSMLPNAALALIPGLGGAGGANDILSIVRSAATGVKFGKTVSIAGQMKTVTANDATQLGNAISFLANLLQVQTNAGREVQALVQSLKVTATGATLNLSLSIPQEMLTAMLKSVTSTPAGTTPTKKR